MLKSGFAFSAGSSLALVAWVYLSASLFVSDPLRRAIWSGTMISVPALLGATLWIMIVGSTVELSCIVFQAARARRSHFNTATRSDAAIYATMGAFAILFIGGVVRLAWEIARRPDDRADRADRDMARASVIGLVATFIVGTAEGALMNGHGTHTGGPDKKQVRLRRWTLTGRDMRPPHFLGIHAMQAPPTIAAAAKHLSPKRLKPLFASGALAYGQLTAGLLLQALRGDRTAVIDDRTA